MDDGGVVGDDPKDGAVAVGGAGADDVKFPEVMVH